MEVNNNRMQWFIDQYNNSELEYVISATAERSGTIRVPTGVGKSGIMIADIIHHIDNNTSKEKIIFNVSAPYLQLSQQLLNDLNSVIVGLNKDEEHKIQLFINSSDNKKKYNTALEDSEISVNSFKEIKEKFLENPDAEIAIIASCHLSLHKFVNFITKNAAVLGSIPVITYIDEAHLITNNAAQFHKGNITDESDQKLAKVDIVKLCKYSQVYALSATPDEQVSDIINKRNHNIYEVRAKDAINDNIILSPSIHYHETDSDEIGSDICIEMMKMCKAHSPASIKQKILVTARDSDELISLRKSLEEQNYKVFSTCSKYGFGDGDDETEEMSDEKSIVEFAKAIDEYNDDCFVIHIRQLIQGIDIKSLTGCIVRYMSHGDKNTQRHFIQVVGRVLRPAAGERGMDISKRNKKCGYVMSIIPYGESSENNPTRSGLEALVAGYYGTNTVTFESNHKLSTTNSSNNEELDDFINPNIYFSSDDSEYKKLQINVIKYIKEYLIPKIKKLSAVPMTREGIIKDLERIIATYDTNNSIALCIDSDGLFHNEMIDECIHILNENGIKC